MVWQHQQEVLGFKHVGGERRKNKSTPLISSIAQNSKQKVCKFLFQKMDMISGHDATT
jgi:hypothetical protein